MILKYYIINLKFKKVHEAFIFDSKTTEGLLLVGALHQLSGPPREILPSAEICKGRR